MQRKGNAIAGDDALFQAFIQYLRSDPRFYYSDGRALLAGYRDICKQVDACLPRLFGRLPRLPYGVREIPAFMAPDQTTAYYRRGDIRNAEPGYFFANTYALDQRPRYEMVPLALHEAVPGHHLQIAIAQELEGLPEFRKEWGFDAFGEGWALYGERLGIEMGLYEDPYDNFGRLLYEMWRACRLVVDPGMHAFGWSREQAIEFMMQNTALSPLNIEKEVDRYIAWPGQACAYKIGELKIRQMRARAEEALGEKFDIRGFHDTVLGAGSLPLPVLEKRVDYWVNKQVLKSYD
jgi:prolyl oligopeptidase